MFNGLTSTGISLNGVKSTRHFILCPRGRLVAAPNAARLGSILEHAANLILIPSAACTTGMNFGTGASGTATAFVGSGFM
jgi:hypothetical protein